MFFLQFGACATAPVTATVHGPALRHRVLMLAAAAALSTLACSTHAASAVSPYVQASPPVGQESRTGSATPKPRKLKKVKHEAPQATMPSGETVRARERRLHRECKGRPNAGACLGFAS